MAARRFLSLKQPRIWLAVMVAGFFVASVYVGMTSFYNFQLGEPGDFAINVQALASTVRGHPWPFYESADCIGKGRCSFLLVHPSFMLYAVAPVYGAAPYPITLFAIQSAAIAIAAVPLYWLTQSVTRSSSKALLAAGLYLAWAPLLGGEAFSFHEESFMPLLLFSVAALWNARRYRAGLAAALVAFLTFEIAPVFTFLIAVFFLTFPLERFLRNQWSRGKWRSGGGFEGHISVRSLSQTLLGAMRVREILYSLILLFSSVAAYLLLSLFVNLWGPVWLGVPPPPALPPGLFGILVNHSSSPIQPLGTVLSSSQTISTGEYWLILYALVGFLPLLAPRTLILSVPWIGYTFLTNSDHYTRIGAQYTSIAAAVMFFGLAYGLVRFPLTRASGPRTAPESRDAPISRSEVKSAARHPYLVTAISVGIIGAILIGNAVMMPVDPLLPDSGVKLTGPFFPDYQDHSLTVLPGYSWAEQLVSTIPRQATVTAPDTVFYLIADYPHSFTLSSAAKRIKEYLPENVSDGPGYAFLDVPSLTMPEPWTTNFSNTADYRLSGYVGSTPAGPLLLYAKGYSETAVLYGPSLQEPSISDYAGNGLTPGPIASVVASSSAPESPIIRTTPGNDKIGEIWRSSDVFLPPGNYTIRADVLVSGINTTSPKEFPVLRVTAGGFGAELLDAAVSTSAFASGSWTTLEFNVSSADPVPNFQVDGVLEYGPATISVAAVTINPSS